MNESEVMVFLVTGFLDSGKTQFLNYTLRQDYFQIDGLTLLILCEEGEGEYDKTLLAKYRVKIVTAEERENLTEEWLKELEEEYAPERVVIEYNGMWKVSEFEAMKLPENWVISQKIALVDASTFDVYIKNLKPLFVEMVRNAEMVLFNRCTDLKPLAGYRRSVKVVSPQAEVIFEDEKGEIENIFEDDVPYDLNAPVIRIENEDYGIWYVDMMEHPQRYEGKVVEITAMAMKSDQLPENYFMPARVAMTCCADDTTVLGYLCRSRQASELKPGEWVTIRARVKMKKSFMYYGGVGPVLYAADIESAQPIQEMVYFN